MSTSQLLSARLGALLLCILLFGGTSAFAQAVFGPGLEATLAGMDAGDQLTVVVTFGHEGPVTASEVAAVEGLGITQGITMQSLPIMGVLATPAQVYDLADLPGVRSIWPNSPIDFYNGEARELTGVNKVMNDPNLRTSMGLPYSGKGIGVVVNDSGIDGTLPDLEYGRYVVQNVQGATNVNAVSGLLPIVQLEDQQNTDLGSGHGTHVAGTVGGRGVSSGGIHAGVAPGADLIGYGSGAVLFILDGIGGFDYAITRQFEYNIRIITNSWGSTGEFDQFNPVNTASYEAHRRGITVLFAAGNSGPGENTHNAYSAPWVISVGASEKDGTLVDFSSRGRMNHERQFVMYDGSVWTFRDQPTLVAPGVDIISSRATTGVLPVLSAEEDVNDLGANAAFYSNSQGTSMATPHVAGIVALMLEANPSLQPSQITEILRSTATNMPGREDWEVGAGHVNAYAAMLDVAGLRDDFGSVLTLNRDFGCSVDLAVASGGTFTIDYNPEPALSADANTHTFVVPEGLSELVVNFSAEGLAGETGNPIYPVLIAPDGTEISNGTTLLFAIEYGRTAAVASPAPGTWSIEIRGIQNDTGRNVVSVPEVVNGSIAFKTVNGFNGLTDLDPDYAGATAIQAAVADQLLDCDASGTFRANDAIERGEMAEYLVLGAGIRQATDAPELTDVASDVAPYAEAVVAMGAALKDRQQFDAGVMLANGTSFNPGGTVSRVDLAYALVQSLGLGDEAQAFTGDIVVNANGVLVALDDQDTIPADRRGYVQFALDLGILGAFFTLEQDTYDLEPTLHATFQPSADVTRGAYAVATTRFFANYGS